MTYVCTSTAKQTYKLSKRSSLPARCRDTVDSWSSSDRGRTEKYSSRIPLDVLSSILVRLCDDFETDGVRGVSVVARDICNACLAFPDMIVASRTAFGVLASQCPELPWIYFDGIFLLQPGQTAIWNKFLMSPMSAKLDTMKRMASSLLLSTSGSKAVLACRILAQGFGTKSPSSVPARILNAIQKEKYLRLYPLEHLGNVYLLLESSPVGSHFRLRKTLINLGYTTVAVLEERRAAISAAISAERARLEESRVKALIAKTMSINGQACVCGFSLAVKCSFQRCANCCPGPCVRHGKRRTDDDSESQSI